MISETMIDIDSKLNHLVVAFTFKKKELWKGDGSMSRAGVEALENLDERGQRLARLLMAIPGVSAVQLYYAKPKNIVLITPDGHMKLRLISIAVRETVANMCECSLGMISLSEAYHRAVERELSDPVLATNSEERFLEADQPGWIR